MPVVVPPPPADTDERTLDERVAELEALIKEAQARARRRRQRNGSVALLVVLAALAATYAGGGGLRAGTGRSADASSPRPAATLQQIGHWSAPSGPVPGSWLSSIAVDPENSANVYAAAGGRVFRSTDGGQSWTGGLQIDPRVDVLAVDPHRSSVLYAGAGAGIFKSVDAGRSWIWSGLGQTPREPGGFRGEGDVFSIVVDPTDSSVVYATGNGHLNKSTDGGRTWRTLVSAPSPDALAIDPDNPRTLFATVEGPWTNGKGHGTIALTTDGGATWRTVLRYDDNLWSIAAVPGKVYAVGTAGLLASVDGGVTWSAGKAPAPNLQGLAVDPDDPGSLYVSTWKSGVFRTTDGGQTWSPLGTSFSGPLTIDPRSPTTLYMGTTDGVAKTLDAGKTWRAADSGIVASEVDATATDPLDTKVVYAGTPRGIFQSGDGGSTWKTLELGVGAQAIAVDPANAMHLLAGVPHGILLSTNGGRTWSKAPGSTKHAVTEIVFDARHPGTVLADTEGAGVLRSGNGGLSWRRAAARPGWMGSIVVAGSTLYGNFNGGLLSSTDEGSSWKWHFFPGVGAITRVFAVDPADPHTLYAAIGDSSSRLHPSLLARSTDDGMHWRFLGSGTHRIDATALAIDPRHPSTMYAGTQFSGVLRSTDGGATWQALNGGLQARVIDTLSLDRTGTTLYAGTSGAGVQRVRLR